MYNLFRTALTVANIVLAALVAGLIATGCADVGGVLECSKSWLSPVIVGYAMIGVNVVKLLIRVFGEGSSTLVK